MFYVNDTLPPKLVLPNRKVLFIARESGSESEMNQRTSEKDQSTNGKHQKIFRVRICFALGVNTA